MRSLFALIPNQALILAPLVIGICLILGIVNRSKAFSIIGLLILIAMFRPFTSAIYHSLPLWAVILISVIAFLTLFRTISTLLFGEEATGHILGEFLITLFSVPFRFVGYLFRLATRRR